MIDFHSLTHLEANQFAQWAEPAPDGSLVASLVLPMERKGAETRKNPIVFKNALAEARDRQEEHWPEHKALQQALADQRLEQLQLPTVDFWQHQDKGLILLIREDAPPLAISLPHAVDSFVYLGARPYLLPALYVLDSLRYHALVLDLQKLRLFESTQWQTREIPVTHGPESLEEAMRYDDPEKSLQFRRVSSSNLPGPGGGEVAFHGHGLTGQENRKKKVRRFFEMVSSELTRNLGNGGGLPLVLCGPEFEVGYFRQVCRHPHLCEDTIMLNPSSLPAGVEETIRGWIGERNADFRREACQRLEEQISRGHASVKLKEVVGAAVQGRIDSLFVHPECRRFGRLDSQSGEVTLHQEWEPGDADLVAEAAVAAAGTGSRIHCLEPSEILPEDAPLAGIFRY